MQLSDYTVMVNFHPQFIVDENQNQKSVIIPFEEWKKIMEELEELEDIRAYDEAKKNKHNSITFEDAVKNINQKQIATGKGRRNSS